MCTTAEEEARGKTEEDRKGAEVVVEQVHVYNGDEEKESMRKEW